MNPRARAGRASTGDRENLRHRATASRALLLTFHNGVPWAWQGLSTQSNDTDRNDNDAARENEIFSFSLLRLGSLIVVILVTMDLKTHNKFHTML